MTPSQRGIVLRIENRKHLHKRLVSQASCGPCMVHWFWTERISSYLTRKPQVSKVPVATSAPPMGGMTMIFGISRHCYHLMPYCVFLPHNLYESGWPVLWKLSSIKGCVLRSICFCIFTFTFLKSQVFSSIRWHTRFLPNLSGSHLGSWGRVPFLQPQRRCGSSFFLGHS